MKKPCPHCARKALRPMSPAELRDAGATLYPTGVVANRLAEALGVDPSTVRRWISGAVPIPNPVKAAVECFLTSKRGRKG